MNSRRLSPGLLARCRATLTERLGHEPTDEEFEAYVDALVTLAEAVAVIARDRAARGTYEPPQRPAGLPRAHHPPTRTDEGV